ncbi:MAG: hypothetical protein ABW185_13470, partial [Sedimenticola sp.]
TVDEALYCKLMTLKWLNESYQEFLIPRLGGFHTTMNFMKSIGQHMQSTGLMEVWVDSNLLGQKTAENVMAGKGYEKSVRAHKITAQALWEIVLPQFLEYLQIEGTDLKHDIEEAEKSPNDDCLTNILSTKRFRNALSEFGESHATDSNFMLWWEYLNMVRVLLMFIRAQRDGLWDLHLTAFSNMLPYFHRYDHTNYAKWGVIYLAEMKQLPEEIAEQFQLGNFVVKLGKARFNQVDPDQAQEWLNGTGKRSGGIVGITKNISALSRWSLSFSMRTEISLKTRELYGLKLDDSLTHKEASKSRRQKDLESEESVVRVLRRFGVFAEDSMTRETLENIATKDQATEEITNALLQAKHLGQKQVEEFVHDRLTSSSEGTSKPFSDPLKKNKPLTFTNVYDAPKESSQKGKTVKADRSILQRLLIAYEAGRHVDLEEILKHELMSVPLSLAETSGNLRGGQKSLLIDQLTQDIVCPSKIDIPESATLVIDGQALVHVIGKPKSAITFGDYANVFVGSVFQSGTEYSRIDVVFDRYYEHSTKSGTRLKRKKAVKAIRRIIGSRDVPLPQDWHGFLSHAENKADLARFLSEELETRSHANKTVVVAGGFVDETRVVCNDAAVDITQLQGCHEEADTRIVLHCINSATETIVVSARDTDVLLLLIAHYPDIRCQDLWMRAGTSQQPKFISITKIVETSCLDSSDAKLLLPFHSITGCDTTSFLAGHSKKTALRTFYQHKDLLRNLGVDPLTEETLDKAETFVCRLYKVADVSTTDKARVILFKKAMRPEILPPTSDAVRLHVKRAHFQALVWLQATALRPTITSPTTLGWEIKNGHMTPTLTSLPPVPESCIQLITCGCTTRCSSLRCKCRKSNLFCTGACKCIGDCMNAQSEQH